MLTLRSFFIFTPSFPGSLFQLFWSQAPPGYEEPRVSKPQPMEEEEPELDVSQVSPSSELIILFF